MKCMSTLIIIDKICLAGIGTDYRYNDDHLASITRRFKYPFEVSISVLFGNTGTDLGVSRVGHHHRSRILIL